MSHVEPPGWSDPVPPGPTRYRARHGPAAPEAYPEDPADDPADDPAAEQPAFAYGDWPPSPPVLAEEPAPPEPPPVPAPPPAPAPANGRAGRNLPAAIAVGVCLGGVVIASLLLWRPAFLLVVAAAAGIASWEMTGAVSGGPAGEGASDEHETDPAERPHPPLLPLLAGCVVMITLAWFAGVEALVLGLTLTVLATLVWRLADGPVGYHRDIVAATLIAVYVPFLAGFAVLLARPDDGHLRVIVTLAAVVLSDTGGYVAGVFFGKRPMAPTVSPKKSWEGLGGSLVATGIGGALLMFFVLHRPWWYGVAFGLAIAAVSVLGDLAESLLKRDLGVKDMSNLLPGHGGLMDRLDSILFAAPAAFVLLSLLAPPA
ncbi:MAG: phosphatidate cytidylyltransferase [Micromonosporaceae bacterium]